MLGIGLQLNKVKAKTLSLGPEITRGGDFSDPADWAVESGWTITGGQAVGVNTSGSVFQGGVALEVGKIYRIEFEVVGYTGGNLEVYAGAFSPGPVEASANGVFVGSQECTVANQIRIQGSNSWTGNLNYISVKEIL